MYSRYLPNLPLFGNFSISFPFSLGSGIIEWKKRFQNRKIEFSRLIWQLQSCLFPVRKIWQSTTELIFTQTTTWCCFLPFPELAHQPSEFPGGLNSRCTTPAQSLPKWAKNSNSHPFKGKIKATFIKLIRYLGEFPFVRTECYQNNASPGGNLPGTKGKLWAVVNYLLFIVISMYRQIPRRDLIICYSFSHFLLVNRQTSGLCVGCWWENGFPMFSMFNIFFSTELLN